MFALPITKTKTKPTELKRATSVPQRPIQSMVDQAHMLQRTIGNQAMLRLLAQRASVNRNERGTHENAAPLSGGIQAKLKVGAVNDPLEHEADRVAEHVMRMPAPGVSASAAPLQVSRKCAACEEEERLQKKEVGPQAAAGDAPASVHDTMRSPGQPLDLESRAFFEPRFGNDFSQVRIHAGTRAAESACSVHARAYTVGQHVVFGRDQYAPRTANGRHLLAHELTHTLQQRTGVAGLQRAPDPPGSPPPASSGLEPDPPGSPPPASSGLEARLKVIEETGPAAAARLEGIIRTGGPIPTTTKVIGAMIIDVEGYQGPKEMRSINGADSDALGQGAPVFHAPVPNIRTLSQTQGRETVGPRGRPGREPSIRGPRRESINTHINDAEIKLFEYVIPRLPKGAKGTIRFTTWRVQNGQLEPYPACSGCIRASFETAGTFKVDLVSQVALVSHAPVRPPRTADLGGEVTRPAAPPARTVSGQLPPGSVFAQRPPSEMFARERSIIETEPPIIAADPALRGQVTKGTETTPGMASGAIAPPARTVSGQLPPGSVLAQRPPSEMFARERSIIETEPPIIAADPALRGQITKGTETTHVESGTGMASGAIAPQPPTQFSTGTRASAGVLGVLTIASEILGSIALAQAPQRSYNARMEATVRFFNEFGGKPQWLMEDVDTGVEQPSGTKSDTGVVYGRWVAPRLESVNVQALLAALPGRLTTMQSLVEFLGTGRMLQVIEQRGAHYYLTGKGVGYVEITEAIERIRSNLMRGLDERARAQMASKGGAGVYRIRSSDVTIYRYAKGVREPWRLRHIEVPILTTQEFSGANMWVREVGDKGDRVHVEPANAEAEGLAQNAWYIVPKAVGDVYDEVEGSGRTIKSRQPADGPLEGFIAAPLPPELGYTRYMKHPNPDWREFTIAIGELRQFWVDRDDLEPVSADQVAAYARGTPTAPPPSHFFRSEERRLLAGGVMP